MEKEKDLEYWKNNAEEDYLHVPISVLRYITVLEQAQPQDKETFLKADLTINGIYQILGQFGEEHEPIKKKFREYCETLTKKQK